MDKLQPQTVYVPVDRDQYDMTGKLHVPMISKGMVSQVFSFDVKQMTEGWKVLQELPGVYPLTGKELAALLKQTWQEAINRADKDNGVDMTDAEEDGPIMNFSDFLKSKGIEI